MPERVARELDTGRGGSGSTVGWRDLTDEEIKAIQRVSQGAARRRMGWRGLDVRGRKEGSVVAAEKRRQAERVVRRMREEKRVRDERDGFVGGGRGGG